MEEGASTDKQHSREAVKSERFTYRITIRMTRRERAIIGKKAQECDLSVSRYLVEAGTRETNLLPEEARRLVRLKSYFEEAGEHIRGLSALPLWREYGQGSQAALRLREVLCVLESLSAEIGRRLP